MALVPDDLLRGVMNSNETDIMYDHSVSAGIDGPKSIHVASVMAELLAAREALRGFVVPETPDDSLEFIYHEYDLLDEYNAALACLPEHQEPEDD